MADVMPRGHDGDGREDPPPPGGQGRGEHEMDVVPPNRRGKAKNLALFSKWKDNGKRPLPLELDDATSTT